MIYSGSEISRGRAGLARCSAAVVLLLMAGLVISSPAMAQSLQQQYQVPIEVEAGTADRQDNPVDAAIDLTAFLAGIAGTLDVQSLQVAEVDNMGTVIDDAVLFQFDQEAGFDPTTNAAGNLVFIMDGSTTAGTTRYYQLAFDLDGVCPDCPAPPIVPSPVSVDSLTYENQLTYEVVTPRATYMYHKQGGGLAGLLDQDTQDWISFHDVAGSQSAGEYRGIPNLVFTSGDPANSFFHPGFTNASSELVHVGPLKITVRSQAGPPVDLWEVQWEFYSDFARMKVLSAGAGDADPYWFLYEGTIGGGMDAGDVVVTSDGVTTSAFDYADEWQDTLAEPKWVYFRDTSASRALFLSDDQGTGGTESYRPLGQSAGSTPEMTVFGFGRSLASLSGQLSGTDRSFTLGFVEDHTVADADIARASEPMNVLVDSVAQPQTLAVSDDFSTFELNDTLWSFVDPVGDSSIYQANGVVSLSIPGGTDHDVWIGGNQSARIMQPVTDGDMGLEVKFESTPASRYQLQGMILEESPGNFIRLDFFHDGAVLKLFGASFAAGSPTILSNTTIPTGNPLWLRVERVVNTFTVTWSNDGSIWQTGFTFDHNIALNSVGVFAGNNGSPSPAFTAVVDYFFNTDSPIVPEDDGLVDIWPPLVSDIIVIPDPATNTALVTCTTNEAATTLLSYGLDSGYGIDVAGTSGDGFSHQFVMTGLTPDMVYHFSIEATDALSNAGATPDQQFLNEAIDPPTITVWGGLTQRVGHLGTSQADFNLMGNIALWENLSTLGYSLNSGPELPLNWGNRDDGFGDGRRLARNGDFNLDLPLNQLLPGANTISLHAVDIYGGEDQVDVTVTLETGSSPLPYSIDWETVTNPQDVGQSVDGNWAHDPQGLRTVSTGYDRLFLLGEQTWQDYEIVCPITIHEVQNPTGPVSGAPGIGFLMRFTGHVIGAQPDEQPKWGYQPFGGLGWLRYYSNTVPTIQFYHGDANIADNFGLTKAFGSPYGLDVPPELIPFGDESKVTNFASANKILVGETFFMKMRCETLADTPDGDGVTRYSYKVWLSTESEPLEWNFQVDQESDSALREGSVALLAHHIDVTFGDITIVDLSTPTPPTALDDDMSLVTGTSRVVDVLANDSDVDGSLDTGTVNVNGLPSHGTITNIDAATGAITYLHDGGVAVADSFTYTVDDDSGLTSNTAKVRVEIGPPTPPTAVDDLAFSVLGSSVDVVVVQNDVPGNGAIDPSTVVIGDSPLNGSITNYNPATGSITYLHDGGTELADSFTYTVNDINGTTSNTATVWVSIGQIPEGDFISDDFNACVLGPVWSFVDPVGDASPPTIQGAFSGDAQMALTVPGGSSHELFDGVIGAPYIIQSTSDNDFTVEVKFDSILPTADFAEQGIIVRQDDTNWLRLEFYSRGSDQVYILAGLPNNMSFPTNEVIPGVAAGSSPLYMRVNRAGDIWTQSYSTDGSVWTDMTPFEHPLNVTGVGVYAGNAGSNPEHTILVDYFSNSLAPIVEPDDTGLNTLSLSTAGNGSVIPDPDQPTYNCGDPVQLTASPDPGWAFDSWSGDLTGSINPTTVIMNAPMNITANFILSTPQPPVANDDLATAVIGLSVVADVLVNDTDANGNIDPSTVLVITDPLNGTITGIDPTTGAITYLHDDGVEVADSFTYTVEDDTGLLSNVATVQVTIEPVIAPTAVNDAVVAQFNSSVNVDVLLNDTPGNGAIDPSTVIIINPPSNGSISGVNPATGVVTYSHDGGVEVADSFTYTVDDINGGTSNVAMVMVTIGAIPPGDFISDDFNACDLDPVWTFVDPLGDTTTPPFIQGAFSGDAQVAITVPGGSAHQIYNGVIEAPHIIQSTSDSDFTAEVKFDSVLPSTDFAMQGIVVRQDDSEWLRLEFYSLNSGGIAVIAVDPSNDIKYNVTLPGLTAGTSPLYMRVQRAGNTWTQSYSTDGTAWTAMTPFDYTLGVTGIGVYAGNAGSSPGHTVLVDYFSNSLAPIVEPDDTGQNTLAVNMVGDGSVGIDPEQATYNCGDPVQLTAIPDAGFSFDSWSGDLTGSTNPTTIIMNKASIVTATFVPAGPPEAPVAVDDAASVLVANSVEVDVLANDTDANNDIDPSTVVVVANPLNGSITGIDPVTGAVTYLHNGGVEVADSFTYTVEDATGLLSNVAIVQVTIEPLVPPTAVADAVVTLFNSSVEANVLANDIPGNGALDPSMVSIIDSPLNGFITDVNPATGVITYLHDGGVAVADSFTYTVGDINGATSNVAVVRVTIGNIPPGDFISDDFNSCELDPVWSFVDPLGDTTVPPYIQGAFSGDAQIAITVPGGAEHQLYDGTIEAPYIIQSTSDSDFTLEVKFSTALPSINYAEQGIIVRQDDSTWLRLEFFSLSSNQVFILAGNPVINDWGVDPVSLALPAGTNPLYMRVQRVGNTWTQSWSTDGAVWNIAGSFDYTMAVSGVGVYAGNAGSNPEHTVLVDYFSNSLAPIIEPDDTGQNILSLHMVGNGTVTPDPDLTTYSCGEPVQLTATPDAGWMFGSWSGDLTGSTNPATIIMNKASSVTANFIATSGNVVAVNTSGQAAISTSNPCAGGIPVQITRDSSLDMRGFTVTIALDNLDLCNGVASILEDDYLNSVGVTNFLVTDNLDGSYEVQGDITGEPCGATALSGTLFTLDVTNTIPDGVGTLTVGAVELRDCASAPLAASSGSPATILIDTTAPAGVTNLASTKVMTGNPAGNVVGIDVGWTPSADPDAVGVLVYRKGFGSYPEYNDGGGAAPVLPADPSGEGWELVGSIPVGTSATTDLASARDFWYFCTQAIDAAGNPSVAIMTGGLTNYILGDVSDGGSPILDGDNQVGPTDLTLLGAHYGTTDGEGLYLNTLDIGPTSDMSTNGLPTTDNQIEFEDLILLGINYSLDAVGKADILVFPGVPSPAFTNTMAVHLPEIPGTGQTFQVELAMAGDGNVQGMTIPLDWDENVVVPVAAQGGPLLSAQGGNSLTLSAKPGVIDICLAGVRETGISGVGTVATVTFKVLSPGMPGIQLTTIDARDRDNNEVSVTTTATSDVDGNDAVPAVSALHDNYPNPFNPMTTIAFDLATAGRVRISIYSLDGRRVRSLVDESLAAGRHSAVWDGKDQNGRSSASGTYLFTMEGPGIKQTRRMLLIK